MQSELKEYFKEHIEEIKDYLISLYEFQEGIKFIERKNSKDDDNK